MREYDGYAKFDDAEDEDSIPAEPFAMVDDADDIGVLSFGMEKSEAGELIGLLFAMLGEMRTLASIAKQLSNHSTYCQLTHSNITEILDYAIEREWIKLESNQYVRIN